MRPLSCLIMGLFVLVAGGAASAGSDIPDLRGKWVWKDQAIRHFQSSEAVPQMHTHEKTTLAEIALTLIIDKQEGFRFSGTKSSGKWKESVSGVIGFDNKTVYMVDNNGFLFCRLVSPDKMEQIYLHVLKTHSVAARGIMVRQRQ